MSFILLFGILSISSFPYGSSIDVDYDGVLTVRLWHSMATGPGVPQDIIQDRGNITVQSIQTGSVALSQAGLRPDDIANLQHLAKLDGFYRLRATVHTNDGKERNFLSFVKACSLVESQLSDVITLTFDHTGSVIAVSLSAPFVVCQGIDVPSQHLRFFNTTVLVRHMEPGPVPDTATYIQKVEREREAKERGEVKDNRTFLAKYWMYIVPMLIFMLLSSVGNPEGGGGGGGGGGGR